MNTQQMIDFAREQLEIFSPTCQMGVFLQCVIDKLDVPTAKCGFDIGDIVKRNDDDIRAVLLDKYFYNTDRGWYVLTEIGCIEHWEEDDFGRVGHTDKICKLMESLR